MGIKGKTAKRMVAQTVGAFEKADILVNNSGIGGPTASVADLGLDEWNEAIALDLTGGMFFCKQVLKCMIPPKSGNIANIAGDEGRWETGGPDIGMHSPQCCAKMGLIGLPDTSFWVPCVPRASPASSCVPRGENSPKWEKGIHN